MTPGVNCIWSKSSAVIMPPHNAVAKLCFASAFMRRRMTAGAAPPNWWPKPPPAFWPPKVGRSDAALSHHWPCISLTPGVKLILGQWCYRITAAPPSVAPPARPAILVPCPWLGQVCHGGPLLSSVLTPRVNTEVSRSGPITKGYWPPWPAGGLLRSRKA